MQAIAATVQNAAAEAAKASQPQPRLVRAAHEFEAQMMKELLKPMTGDSALTGEEDGAEGSWGSNGAMGEFASEALGQALSQHGGFGMADRIVHDLSHSGTSNHPGKVTRNLHADTVIRASQSLK
jgi:Rod binding domain-containing protein